MGARSYTCTDKPESEFLNLAYSFFENGEGSYLYNKKFEMIDQMLLSINMIGNNAFTYSCGSFEIIKPPFMVYKEGSREGCAIPTYSGNRYIGGYSDHFPVGAKFYVKGN